MAGLARRRGADAGARNCATSWEFTVHRCDRMILLTVVHHDFDREADCLALLELLRIRQLDDEDARRRTSSSSPIRASPPFREAQPRSPASRDDAPRPAARRQPGQLRRVGGFSRGMIDSVEEADSPLALLLDDDVRPQPESIGGCALRGPTRESHHRRRPHAEPVDRPGCTPSANGSPGEASGGDRSTPSPSAIDLSAYTVENTPALSRRIDVDFNGWWMCLVPATSFGDRSFAAVLHQVGRCRVRLCAPATGRAHGHPSRRGALAHAVDRQGRRTRLAGVLPAAQSIVTALLHGGRRRVLCASSHRMSTTCCVRSTGPRAAQHALRDVLLGPAAPRPGTSCRSGARGRVLARGGPERSSGVDDAPVASGDQQRPQRPHGVVACIGAMQHQSAFTVAALAWREPASAPAPWRRQVVVARGCSTRRSSTPLGAAGPSCSGATGRPPR